MRQGRPLEEETACNMHCAVRAIAAQTTALEGVVVQLSLSLAYALGFHVPDRPLEAAA